MQTGIIDALIDGTHKVVGEPIYVSSATDLVSFDVSDRVRKKMKLISVIKSGSTVETSLSLTINNNSGSNYGTQGMVGTNTSPTASSLTSQTSQLLTQESIDLGTLGMQVIEISKNIDNTTMSVLFGGDFSSSYVHQVGKRSCVWDNSDDIESIELTASETDGIGAGSFFVLIEEVEVDGMQSGTLEPNKITGGIELVAEAEVTGSATDQIILDNLNGDTDKIWFLSWLGKGTGTGTNRFRLNGDSGANYNYQRLQASGGAVFAQRLSNTNEIESRVNLSSGKLEMHKAVIFALSGNIRLILLETVSDISASGISSLDLLGYCWTNTADEITSIEISNSGGVYIDIGSKVELYKINDL